jgi:hypothetical protein
MSAARASPAPPRKSEAAAALMPRLKTSSA